MRNYTVNHPIANKIAESQSIQLTRRLRRAGLYPYFRATESAIGPHMMYEGREILMFGSNDYLGMVNHPRVKEKAIEAIQKFGTGQGGAPIVCGRMTLHAQLEERLAGFLDREACTLFSSGYQANVGTITSLAQRGDCVICDRLSHASIIDGAALSGARLKRFAHNDVQDLQAKLREAGPVHKVVVVDGVYSMNGDLAPLVDITSAASTAGGFVIVDDAHGLGVLGANGRGTAEHFDCESSVDLITGAMSKSLATAGGFAAGTKELIEYIKHHARAGMFSAACPAANVATALAALDIIEQEPERRHRVLEMAQQLRASLEGMGFAAMGNGSPIVSIHIGDTNMAFRLAKRLFDEGLFAIPVVSPGVAPGMELIRLHATAVHLEEDVQQALNIFSKVARDFSVRDQTPDSAIQVSVG